MFKLSIILVLLYFLLAVFSRANGMVPGRGRDGRGGDRG